ncbi:ABC transporter ATP-binding protein [Furfurilactobacillus siliginis]|uniref:ABC transporter ATP-binding protein n=1 Tax=Furfurilactobacillus siliginis TaxID=348151 RepID=UPI0007099C3B|nr:ABC transporter transmembrane domain-containing protein [Furfurilactobacillus siliginis]
MSIFRKLSWYFKDEWRVYMRGLFGLFMTAILGIVPPRLIGELVDMMSKRTLTAVKLAWALVIMVVVALLAYGARYIWRTAIWGGAAKLEKTLRARLYEHFMQMDTAFYQRYRTGDLMAHATNDLTAIQRVAGGGILQFADSIITGGTTLIAMFVLVNWRLTILAVLPLPLIAVVARYVGTKIHVAFGESQAAFSRLNNKAQESIEGIKVIKTLGQERQDEADFEQQVTETIKINRYTNFLDALFDPLITLIIGLSYVATIVLGGRYVTTGVITLGQLVTFIAYVGMLVWPMFAIGLLFNTMERGNASYDRVNFLLQEKSSIIERQDALATPAQGPINFDVTSFSYPGDQTARLQNVSFELKAGQTLGIVGRVGAGKSSIIKLLLRQFDDYDGQITMGEHDIRDYQLDAYVGRIGYVPQDSFLFSTSIKDNIAFSNPEMTQAAVTAAAHTAAFDSEVAKMPEGYATEVGEEGVSLSGGQKQRLAIARALVIDPELLILDDALSAVDAKTEAQILERLGSNRAGKTTIIAAHRLSSVVNADQILVVDHGVVTERGTHAQLMAQQGWYKRMYDQQQLADAIGGGNN